MSSSPDCFFKAGDLVKVREDLKNSLGYRPYQRELNGYFLIVEHLTPKGPSPFNVFKKECFRCMSILNPGKKFVFYEHEILPLA